MTFKTIQDFAAVLIVVSLSPAAVADALYDEIRVCRSLPSDEARLACYDAAADRAQPERARTAPDSDASAPVRPATPEAPAAAAAGTATVSQEELFGKNAEEVQRTVEEATGAERMDSLSARITDLRQIELDKVVISLDNGQVWQQTTSSSLRLREGDEVEIERGALGSYLLQKVGSKRSMRVQRLD